MSQTANKPAPSDVLAPHVAYARMDREAVEEQLERLPRWRFRRRAKLRRLAARRRRREQQLIDLIRG